MNNKEILELEKLIFETVYQWGRFGVVVDHTSPHYKKLMKILKTTVKVNESDKSFEGVARMNS